MSKLFYFYINMSPTITAIILTKNEEKHIRRCITSLQTLCTEIWVVDSYSTDQTCLIADQMGARVVQHEFVHQAQQFNWAIDNLDISGEWIWRVDADEYISTKLTESVTNILPTLPSDVNGIYVQKLIIFLGKPLFHGNWHPAPQIKIIRRGHGRSENKMMDEHLIVTDGRTISIDGDQVDDNLNDLSWWTQKHIGYAEREVVNMLAMEFGMDEEGKSVKARFFGNNSERKRWMKVRYARMPLYIRPFLNFFVRYFLFLGFLDFNHRWYILQGFWYRYLVDAKIYELKKSLNFDDEKIKAYISERLTSSAQ